MCKVGLLILCGLAFLMTLFNLSDYATAESASTQQIRRPSNNVIEIRNVTLNNIDKGKRSERYEVQMSIRNSDENWRAAEVCVHIRLRDPAKKVVDAHQTACLQNLKPLEERRFVVTYAGSFPRFVSEVISESQVSAVKWTPNE